jgi:hypothetical protein
VSLLTNLDDFSTEHRCCGDLDGRRWAGRLDIV